MRGPRHLGLVAAAATLLAAAPLGTIFDRWTWLIQCFIAVALIAGAAALARWLRAPMWAQVLGMVAALLLALTWMFPSGDELLGLIPTAATFGNFGDLLRGSMADMRQYGVPLPDTVETLRFITVIGVGAVAIVVDLLTVGLRRPALAGLPMLAIYSVPVAVYTDSVPALPFVIGAIGFLWLLVADNIDRVRRFGRRFTGDGRDVSVWEPSPLAAAGRRLAVVGVALAVLLPVVVPGMTGGLLNTFTSAAGDGEGDGGQGGAPGRVNLFAALSGQLNQARIDDMVRVTTNEPTPFYLRFGVADDLQSDGFRVRSPKGRSVRGGLPDPRKANRDGVIQDRYRASVEITSAFNMPLLPVYAEPTSTDGIDGSWSYDSDMQLIYSNRNQSRGKKYSFDYVRTTYSPAALAGMSSPGKSDPIRQFTKVPEQIREVNDLVDKLVKNQKSDYDRTRAIYDYFSDKNGFRYSPSTQGGTTGKDILDFLTNKVGFCQQYAAAMAWLVRAAGVPARVAFGFTNGSDKQGDSYVLTNHNLHAWTEVHLGDAGWVPFDATPKASVPGSTSTSWAPDTNAVIAPIPSTGPNAGPDPTSSVGPAGDVAEKRDKAEPVDQGAVAQQQALTWPWWTTFVVLLVLAVLAVPAVRRILLRRRRAARTAAVTTVATGAGPAPPGVVQVVATDAETERARADAHAAWDELIDTLIDFRIVVDPTETPRVTAARLVTGGLTDTAAAGAHLLGVAEERARYARVPVHEGPLSEALGAVRRSMARSSGRKVRLMAAVLPPSVLLRWRLAIMDGSGRLVAAFGRGRDALLRWSPRRLIAGRAGR
jgi:transglutaminase-like putative cysteine protease